jgi:protein-tyrosine phosphatase
MRVLVVCTANIARSPLAEAMLARELAAVGASVSSAGVQARIGHPAARGSFLLAEERGLDLSTHRSRPVTPELVQEADLVLTMSERQRDVCSPLVAGSASRVFTFRELGRLLTAVDLAAAPTVPRGRLRWLTEQLHLARPRARPPSHREDVEDPIGREWPHWAQLGEELDRLSAIAVRAIVGEPSPTAGGSDPTVQ